MSRILAFAAVVVLVSLFAGCGGGFDTTAEQIMDTQSGDIPLPPFPTGPIDVGVKGGPRFNYLTGDYELVRAANKTMSENWGDPVLAKSGDIVTVLVYIHNGSYQSVANNVRVKATLPVTTADKVVVVVSADNAATITDTVVNNRVVGNSGLTVKTVAPMTLTYIPGSTKLINAQLQTTSLPNGIVGSKGINIGSMRGCWQYAVYITFKLKIK